MNTNTRQPAQSGSLHPICSAWELMDWPDEEFKIWDDGNPHGELYLVLPGGQMVSIACHADYATDLRRAEWMRDTLNAARVAAKPNVV